MIRRSKALRPSLPLRIGLLLWLSLGAVAFVASGCRRAWYRTTADSDAYALIDGKTCNEHWPLDGYTIETDPTSRMFDPFNPDYPPMPPDDPAAHQYMHCIYCMRGYPCWHANGDTKHVQNPTWRGFLAADECGRLRLDADAAVRAALLHSPDFQRELEDLYLSALDVSFERFRFEVQYFGGNDVFFTADGRARRGGGGESSSLLDVSPNMGFSRMFASGSELVVGFANSLVWQFSGPDTHSATSLLDFTFIQPLLRAGGRDRVLERLTLSERALLSNVRQMERFRRGFYLNIVTGRNPGGGPSRRGGVFGGAGLQGFTGVGGGGFGQLVVGPAGGGTGAGGGQASGFLGLLQDQQDIRNQRSNIASLRSSVDQLEAIFQAGRIDYFQVELARQALFNAQSQLFNAELAYETRLDTFKLDLGLPPDIELIIEDELITPFQLIDPRVLQLQEQLVAVQQRVGNAIIELLEEAEQADNLDGDQDDRTNAEDLFDEFARLKLTLVTMQRTSQQIKSQLFPLVSDDIEKLKQALPERLRSIDRLERLLEQRAKLSCRGDGNQRCETDADAQDDPDALPDVFADELATNTDLPLDANELNRLLPELNESFAAAEDEFTVARAELDSLTEKLEDLRNAAPQLTRDELRRRFRRDLVEPLPDAINDLVSSLLSLTLVQARARTETATLVPIELEWCDALDTAARFRRDWMNARAALVDSWRLVQFNADNLESRLDIVFSGDISNVGDNPLRFRDTTGRLRVGLEFDAPLSLVAERNTYRQALIEYQQARRAYYQFEDRIGTGLRSTIRGLNINQLNFEIRRAAVGVAIAQVELSQLRLREPPKPQEVAQLGATTARDLVQALSALLDVQNDFLSVWINHEVLRRSLDFDMGTMHLDPDGTWVDPGPLEEGHWDDLCDDSTGLDTDLERLPPMTEQIERLPLIDPFEDTEPQLQLEAGDGFFELSTPSDD